MGGTDFFASFKALEKRSSYEKFAKIDFPR
jgi:hypothetical protein